MNKTCLIMGPVFLTTDLQGWDIVVAGCGIQLVQFLIIAFSYDLLRLFTMQSHSI